MPNPFTIEGFPTAASDGTSHGRETVQVDKQVPRTIGDDQQELLCFQKLRASGPSADKEFSSAARREHARRTLWNGPVAS